MNFEDGLLTETAEKARAAAEQMATLALMTKRVFAAQEEVNRITFFAQHPYVIEEMEL